MVYNVFFKHICILVMAEGGYDPTDPTTDKTPLIPGTGDDDDDDTGIDWNTPVDPEPETDKRNPFEPTASSTPADSEHLPMTRLPPEKQGFNPGITIHDSMMRIELEDEFPNLSSTELEFRYKTAPKSGGAVIEVKYYTSDKWYRLYTLSKGNDQKTLDTALPKQITQALGPSAEEIETRLNAQAETSFTTPPDSIPSVAEVAFADEEENERSIARVKRFIQDKFPNVDFHKLGPIGLGKKIENRFNFVKIGEKGGETRIIKPDNSDLLKSFVASNKKALGESAEELVAKKSQEEKDLRLRLLKEERQLKDKEKQTVLEQKAAENVRNLTRRIEQTRARREELETEHGSTLEQQNEIDRLKQLERNLKADLENERVELKQLQKRQHKTLKEAKRSVGKLKQEIYAAAKERNELELGLNRTKPLNELDERYETLRRENEADRRIVDDDNATSNDKQAATERIIEREEEMERLGPQIQEREEALPLRERVKNIFKKYGWTLQAVALAVGIVLSALALAATNGLKAGTKALGNGPKAIGQKLGSLLPGLIGSIVSHIFKAAGSVLSFLGEHAWLLILAVVAFFMERLLKKRKSK